MLQNLVDYKAKSFLSERNSSSIAYEVKAVRAMWDPSLSIPGTNRRGGWRCPVGTRYGGQITDRFGRQCGWGAARRIANMISDVGERLERADDGKRGRRIARREQRMIRHLAGTGNGAGRIERGLRGVAERLDGGDSSTNIPSLNAPSVDRRVPSIRTPEAPRELTPARPAPGARVRRPNPNLRDSEARRMEREIAEPGAPRTGEVPARPKRPARARRPRGENNLRESEQRRMDREIDQPGAPRTDESAARPAPQPRAVDPKLSKEQASDANASEDFAPYVNRKYDEYARNVRLLNENNKPAGMMTRRQWYAVNEDNLREAWGNAHGREAPQDFMPPTPRRRQRANRRRDAVVDTAKVPKARKVPKVVAEDFDQLDRDLEEARGALSMMQQNNATPARIRKQKAKIRKLEGQQRDLVDRARQDDGVNKKRNLLAAEPDDVIREMINEMVRDPDFDEENPEYIRALAEWNRRQNLPDRNAVRTKPRRDPVEPRRPKPKVDLREPDAEMEEALDRDESARRRRAGNSDNAARSEEVRAEAARQADAILADADRERAFAMDDPNEFANAFMPEVWENIPPADRQEFRDQYRDEQGAIDDVLQDLEQRILDEEFGDPLELRERIRMNDEEIRNANKRLERDLQVLRDLQKPAPLERQRIVGQNRRDALSRIAVNARDRRRRELENDKFQEAIDIAAANGSTPKPKRPRNAAKEIDGSALREVFDKDGIDAFDVLGFDRLEVMNNPDNFPHIDNGRFINNNERNAARNARIAKVREDAQRRVDGAIAVRKRLQDDLVQGNIEKENYVMFARGGEDQQKVGLVEIFRRLDEFQEAWEGIIGDLPDERRGPDAKPKAPKGEVALQAQIIKLRADAAEAERIIARLERNGERDVVVRKAQARRDAILNQITLMQDKRPRDADGAILEAPAVPKAPAAPKAPNPTEATVQVMDVPADLRPAVRPSHNANLETDQKEIAGRQLLARRGADAAAFAFYVDQITNKKRAEIAKANETRNKVLVTLLKDIDDGKDINAIIPGGNKSRLKGVLESVNDLTDTEKQQITEANFERMLDGMRRLIKGNWEEIAKLDPLGNNEAEYKVHLGTIAKLEADIVRIENHFWLAKNVEEEVKKAKARKDQGLNRVPNEAVGTAVIGDNLKNQFKEAINRRNNKLVKYLDQRHTDGSPRPYEDMTPAKWDAMTETEKKVYLTAAYSHKKIVGANGKFYQIRVERLVKNGNHFDMVAKIDEITEDGRVLRSAIGNSNRTIYGSGQDKHVYMAFLKLDNPIDKGADIATIYNQHAFLYLSKMGAKYAEVHPAWDGYYVWAKAGYRDGRKLDTRDVAGFQSGLEFYENFGPGGIISSDKEYRQVKKMLEKTRQNPRGLYEAQDWIFAIDDTPGDPVRRNFVKAWMLRQNITIGDGKLQFAREEIGKNLGKKAVKKAARPRAARPRIRVVPPVVRPTIVVNEPPRGQTV